MIAFMLSANSFTVSISRHAVDHQCILREPIPTSDFSWKECNRESKQYSVVLHFNTCELLKLLSIDKYKTRTTTLALTPRHQNNEDSHGPVRPPGSSQQLLCLDLKLVGVGYMNPHFPYCSFEHVSF